MKFPTLTKLSLAGGALIEAAQDNTTNNLEQLRITDMTTQRGVKRKGAFQTAKGRVVCLSCWFVLAEGIKDPSGTGSEWLFAIVCCQDAELRVTKDVALATPKICK